MTEGGGYEVPGTRFNQTFEPGAFDPGPVVPVPGDFESYDPGPGTLWTYVLNPDGFGPNKEFGPNNDPIVWACVLRPTK
jgi:hypothetical protein